MVTGPTKAGKTFLVKKLIQNVSEMFNPAPQEIWLCYSEWQLAYHDLADKVKLVEGFPDLASLRRNPEIPKLLVLDDLMEIVKQKSLSQLFTKGTHHGNISCIHIVQNAFYQGLRTSRINVQYLILLKNPSDQLQASNLARQLFPGKQEYFMESYADACKEAYGYLLVDLSQETPENMRLKTNIFPGQMLIVYVPKV